MLRYRQFLSERDLWLEDWNQKCEQYIMESPGFDINAERTVALNVKNPGREKAKRQRAEATCFLMIASAPTWQVA